MSIASLSGTFTNTPIASVRWGAGSVKSLPEVIRDVLKPSIVTKQDENAQAVQPKAMIITGKSLMSKTPVIKDIEEMLKKEGMYGVTFSEIAQHAPVKDIKRAQELAQKNGIKVLVSVGGGSPIDSAKAIAYFIREAEDASSFIPHIAIPTTLSVAETTQNAGFTSEEGRKIGVSHPANVPKVIIYDPELSMHTPLRLWLSTGMRAMDHAVETLYRDGVPSQIKHMALFAIKGLNKSLRDCKANPEDMEIRTKNMLAAWESLWPLANVGALGLSHALGHGLGATYSIPHGICSCLTLPATIKMMATRLSGANLRALATAAHFLPDAYAQTFAQGRESGGGGGSSSSSSGIATFDDASEETLREAALAVSQSVRQLVDDLELTSSLEEYKVPREHLQPLASKVEEHKPKGAPYDAPGILREILEPIYTK